MTDASAQDIGVVRTAGEKSWLHKFAPWLYLLVPLVLFVTFSLVPALTQLWYSFTDWDGHDKVQNFVGLANYIQLFSNPAYFQVFFTAIYYLGASLIQIVLALYFAIVLSSRVRLRNLFKGIIFFPYLINGVAIGFMFLLFFQPGGVLDNLLGAVGLGSWAQLWLGNPHIINFSIAGTSAWRYTGINFVLFFGAIQSISPTLYEAAALDGASAWQRTRYIILPGIRRVLTLAIVLSVTGSLSAFDIPYIMTGGTNGSATFVIQTIKTGFQLGQFGLASAMAVVLLIVLFVVAWIQQRFFPNERTDIA